MSGYVPCACRDCFDIAISGDGGPVLCLLCKGADCSPWPGEWQESDGTRWPSAVGYECQRPDAYGDPEEAPE